jgi:S-(hydroxymethyl)glutathione dehydrogenase/alcohol dehydrogenase
LTPASIDPVTVAAMNQSILGSTMATSTIRIGIPELISKQQSGELLLDELITCTYPIDQINEAIDSAKNGHAVRNMILFHQADTTGTD